MALHRRLFFLLILAFPLQIGRHFWPEWSYLLGRRMDYLSPTMYVTDIIIFAVLVAWAVSAIRHPSNRQKTINTPMTALLIGALIVTFTNIYFAANTFVALYKWVKVYEYVLLGWYIVRTKVRVNEVAYPLMLAAVYSSFIGVLQFVLQRSLGGILWFLGERTFAIDTPGIARTPWCAGIANGCTLLLRPYATFSHPNVFAGFIAVTLPFFLVRLSRAKQWSVPYLMTGIGMLVTLAGLISSFSRSAWVVSIGILIATWHSIPFYKKPQKTMPLHARGIVLAVAILTGITLLSFPGATDESVTIRRLLNEIAVQIWMGSPVWGVGLGNFLTVLPLLTEYRSVLMLQPVHNIYLLFFAEIGIVGLLIVLALLHIIVRHRRLLIHEFFRNRNDWSLAALSLAGLLLLGTVDHYPLTLQQGQLLFVLFISLLIGRFV